MTYALAVVSATLLILIFPRFSFSLLAPVCLAPLLIAVAKEPRGKQRFLAGWIAGVVYWFGVCYWIQYVLEMHGGLGFAGSWGAFLLFCLAKGLHMAAFAWLAGFVIGYPWALPAIAALWVGIERTHAPLGFAWLALGDAGIDMSAPMRLAPIIGVYGLSFVFALMNAGFALAILRRPRLQLAPVLVLPLLFLLPSLPPVAPGTETAVLVQPNIADTNDWTQQLLDETLRRLSYISLEQALMPDQPRPKLIVWPEVPAPFYYHEDPGFRDKVVQVARLSGAYFAFGSVAHTTRRQPLNSAVMIAPSGDFVGRYDKMHLVPFGEFIPPLFGFVKKISSEAGDYAPGEKMSTFFTPQGPVGAFICYEAVFPHFVRQFVSDGATLLLNLSNDGYFGRSAAGEQHLDIVRMRAAENRRWLLRATNDGITAAIDPAGRIAARFPRGKQMAGRVQYSYVSDKTPYSRAGDWFAWTCLIAGLAACLVSQIPVYRG
jgi:apolipoprotein N-acyltransferase